MMGAGQLIVMNPLIVILAAVFSLSASAGMITITGNSIDLDLDDLIKATAVNSKRDLESLGAAITDRYHERGYTTCYVEQISMGADGSAVIRIVESRVRGVAIDGITGRAAERLGEMLLPQPGELYNRFVTGERARRARGALFLSRLKIDIVNYPESPDVMLKVEARESLTGVISGGVETDPIYGIMPSIGITSPLGSSTLDIGATAGVREGEARRIMGDMRLYYHLPPPRWYLFVGYEALRSREEWQSRDAEYRFISHTASLGTRLLADPLLADLSVAYGFLDLRGYDERHRTARDLRAGLRVSYTDRSRVLVPRDSTDATLDLSAGRSGIGAGPYLRQECVARTTFSPLVWLRLRPRLGFTNVNSDERFYWVYTFDRQLIGFFDDHAATRTRMVAGLAADCELFPETLYAGPFINSGRFRDEGGAWNTRTGGGLTLTAIYARIAFQALYAWDLAGDIGDGGLFLSAEGSF